MSLYWGNKKVSLYLGDKRVKLSIIPAKALPAGYTQLEYIQSSGTQWIDTGVLPSEDMVFETKIDIDISLVSDRYFSSCRVNNGATRYYLLNLNMAQNYGFVCSNSLWINMAFVRPNQVTAPYTVRSHIEKTQVTINVNDVENRFNSALGELSTATLPLFAGKLNTKTTLEVNVLPVPCSLYYARYIDHGTVVRNFIPAIRNSDGVVGVYDTVTKTFFTNGGTGKFVMGSATHNLFTTVDSVKDKAIAANGAIIDAVYSGFSFAYTNYIKVKPNTTYTITGISKVSSTVNHRIATYTSNKTFISGEFGLSFPANSVGKRYTTTFTTSADTEYVIINYIYTEDEQIQLVEGDVNFGSGVAAQALSLMTMNDIELASIDDPQEDLEQE